MKSGIYLDKWKKESASGTYCVESLIGTILSCGGAPNSQVRQVALIVLNI